MYDLRVFFPGEPACRVSVPIVYASDVMASIPQILQVHYGCERIDVMLDTTRLFALDGAGRALRD